MLATERFSEIAYPLAHEPADSQTVEQNTAWIFAGNYHRFAILVSLGDMVTNATFDVQIEQAQDSGGTGVKDVAGKGLTQLTQASGDGNGLFIIELKTDELDVNGGFEYFRVEMLPAAAAVEFSVIVLGLVPRFAPVPTTNWGEIVD